MSEYYCKPCDYTTDKHSNFIRHTNTRKHLKICNKFEETKVDSPLNGQELIAKFAEFVSYINNGQREGNNENEQLKKKTVYGSHVYICNSCGREFSSKSSKYKHQKKCNNDQDKESNSVINNQITNNNLLNNEFVVKLYEQLMERDKKLEEKDKQISKLLESNVNATKTSANTSETTNKSMNMMTYAIKNFKNAPVLKQLEKAQIKEVIDYNGSVNSYENISEYTEELLFEYKKKRIIPYLGKLIGNYFNINVPDIERSAWATDVSRLSFIVMQHVGTGKEWSTDKSGKKFTDSVIDPTLNFINKVLKKFIDMEEKNQDEYYREFNKNRDKCEKIMELRALAVKFMEEILTDKFKKELLKFIAPFFNFDTKRKVDKKVIEPEMQLMKISEKKVIKKESSFESNEESLVNNKEKPKKISKKVSFVKYPSDESIDSFYERPKKVIKNKVKN